MATTTWMKRSLAGPRIWALAGIVAMANLAGGPRAHADSGSPAPSAEKAPPPDRTQAGQALSFFASERSNSPAAALESRPSLRQSGGSLILMELRTHRGTAKTERPPAPEFDPRTKPLGW